MAQGQHIVRQTVQALIRVYQWGLSPIIGYHCRFHPSCSHYALEAIDVWGVRRGMVYVLCRLARCHPWAQGGHDPVPTQQS